MLEISEWRNSSSVKKNIEKKNSFVVVTKPDKTRHFCLLTDFSVSFLQKYSLSTKQNRELYAMLLGCKEKTRLNSASKHTLRMASTSRMRTAISPEQWQPWAAASPLLGLISILRSW